MARIQLQGVSHRFDSPGADWVLRDLDLELTQSRIGVVGGNGSGKSTLARLFNGLVHPYAGTVLVDGQDTVKDGPRVRRTVGFVFTDPDAQIVMPTVAEDVAFSLRRRRLSKPQVAEAVAQALDQVGLDGLGERPAHLLSGGQKQLLAIASVLAVQPQVLVCDEPTTLLDARNSRRVAQLLAGLDQQVVLVTHDLDSLSGFDRVLVVEGGRVVADDSPAPALDWYRRLVR
jgi:biotin transport system ATP-binding protein